jgi:hypothetical protein
VDPSEAREKVVHTYEQHMRQNALIELMKLLAEKTFSGVDYGVVREYVSPLASVTSQELEAAVETYRKRRPDKMPNLDNLMRYVGSGDLSTSRHSNAEAEAITRSSRSLRKGAAAAAASKLTYSQRNLRGTVYDFSAPLNQETALEERQIFIHLLEREVSDLSSINDCCTYFLVNDEYAFENYTTVSPAASCWRA